MSSKERRRKFTRHPVDQDVTVEIGGERLHGHLCDISDGGAFIRLSIEVEVGTDVLLALEHAGIEATGEVRRVTQEGFAIRFDQETVGRIVGKAAKDSTKERH